MKACGWDPSPLEHEMGQKKRDEEMAARGIVTLLAYMKKTSNTCIWFFWFLVSRTRDQHILLDHKMHFQFTDVTM